MTSGVGDGIHFEVECVEATMDCNKTSHNLAARPPALSRMWCANTVYILYRTYVCDTVARLTCCVFPLASSEGQVCCYPHLATAIS